MEKSPFDIRKEKEELENSKRPESAERVGDFLERIHAYEFAQKINQKTESISFNEFKSFLQRLNGIARDIPVKQRKFDGQNVEISGGLLGETVLPPRSQDKEALLEGAFLSAEDLAAQDNAYMVPLVINALHLFEDGNGRTSRIMHLLLNSPDKETFDRDLKQALGVDGRFDTRDINPGLIDHEIESEVLKNHGWDFEYNERGHRVSYHDTLQGGIASAEYGNIDYTKPETENIKKYSKIAEADIKYILTATIDSMSQDKYKSLLWNDKLISPVKMQNLTESDWKLIFENYYNLKKEHIETMIWIFKDPGTYKNPENEAETLKTLFIRKVEEEYLANMK